MLKQQWFWFKTSQKMGQQLKVSSDRLGELGDQTWDPWVQDELLSTTPLWLMTFRFNARFLKTDIKFYHFAFKTQ